MITLQAFRRLSNANSWLSLCDAELPSEMARAIVEVLTSKALSKEACALLGIEPFEGYVNRAAACSGRGTYKTTEDIIVCCHRLIYPDHSAVVAPGSEVVAVIVSPTKAQSSQALRNARPICEKLAALLGGRLRERSAADSAEFIFEIPGIPYVPVLRVGPADEASIRGSATCCVVFDEASWLPTGDDYKSSDRDLETAATPRILQFGENGLFLMTSTPGLVGGLFHETMTEPKPGTLVLGPFPTWQINPSITEADARSRFSEHVFNQELACTTWGARESQFINASAAMSCIDRDEEYQRGPRELREAILAIDVANIHDAIAFAVGYVAEKQIRPDAAPVTTLVVDHVETMKPTAANPIGITRIAERAAAISRAYGSITVIADTRSFVDLSEQMDERGFRVCMESDEDERRKWIAKGGKVLVQRGMAPQMQTPRWTTLRDLTHGGRLSLPDTSEGREGAKELASLRATTLPSKFLKVEAASGAKDDIADVLALLAEACFWRPSIRQDGLRTEFVHDGIGFDFETREVRARNGRHVLKDKNGNVVGIGEPHVNDPDFAEYFATKFAAGEITPNCRAFVKLRTGQEYAHRAQGEAVLADLLKEGLLQGESHPVFAMLEQETDPFWTAKRSARMR